MGNRVKRRRVLALSAAVGGAVATLHCGDVLAQSATWTSNASGTWSNAGNWTGTPPAGTGNAAVNLTFNATTSYTSTVDLGATFGLNTLTLNNTGGGVIDIEGGATHLVFLSGTADARLTSQGTGLGTTLINAAIDFGGTNVNFRGAGTAGGVVTLVGPLAGSGLSTLTFGDGTATNLPRFDLGSTAAVASGSFGGATFRLLGGRTGDVVSTNTAGGINVSGFGTNQIVLQGVAALAASPAVVFRSAAVGGTFQLGNNVTVAPAASGTSQATLSAGQVGGAGGGGTFNVGALTVGGAAGAMTVHVDASGGDGWALRFTNVTTLNGNTTFDVAGGASGTDLTLQGGVVDAAGGATITKTGTGLLSLNGTSNLSGAITVANGALVGGGPSALGSGNVTVGNPGTSVTTLSGPATLTLQGGSNVTLGNVVVAAGTNTLNYLSANAGGGPTKTISIGTGLTLTPGGSQLTLGGAIGANGVAIIDQFRIGGTNTIVAGAGTSLAALSAAGAGSNFAVVAGAVDPIIAHADLYAGTSLVTVRNLPNATGFYFGLATDFNDDATHPVVSVGTNTPWKGVSNDRSARTFGQGTLAVNVGAFLLGTNGGALTLGNGTNPLSRNLSVIGTNTASPTSRATLTARGTVIVDTDKDSFANVQLQVTGGATVTFVRGMGVGTNTLDTTVLSRGLVDFGNNAGAITGNLSVAAGGVLWLHNPGDLNSAAPNASLNLAAGAIVRLADANALSNSPAGAGTGPGSLGGNLASGTGFIVQLETDQVAYLGGTGGARVSPGATYVVAGGNRTQDAGLMLSGGTLTNDATSRSFASLAGITVGAGGATFSSSTANQLTVNASVNAGTNAVTVGSSTTLQTASATPTLGPVTLVTSGKFGTVAFAGSVSAGLLTLSAGSARFSNVVSVGSLLIPAGSTNASSFGFTGPVSVGGTSLVKLAVTFDNDLTLGTAGNSGVVFTSNGTGTGAVRFGTNNSKVTVNGDLLLDTLQPAAHAFIGAATSAAATGYTVINGDLTVRNGSATFWNGTSRVTGNVVVRGLGTVNYLNGAANYVGGLTLNGGTVLAGAGASIVLGGNVTAAGGTSGIGRIAGVLDFGGATRTFSVAAGTAAVDLNVTAALTGGGTGVGLVKDGTGTLALAGASSLTGGASINAGTLIVNNTLALNGSNGGAINVAPGATLDVSVGGASANLANLVTSAGGTVRLSADVGNATAWNAPLLGTLELNFASIATTPGTLGTLKLGGNAVVRALRNVVFGNTGVASFDLGGTVTFDTRLGSLTVNGDLTGSGGFNVTGTNALTLKGNNVFGGSTTISTFLSVASTAAINTTAPILVTAGGTLDVAPGAAAIDLTNLLPVTAGASLRFSTDVGAPAGGATLSPNVIAGGRLEINADVATDPASTLAFNLADGSTLKGIAAAHFGNAGHTVLNLASGPLGITVDTAAGNTLSLTGPIAGAANVTVTGGPGTLSLDAANPGFTGTFTVNNGGVLAIGNAGALDPAKVTLGVGGHFAVNPGAGAVNLSSLQPITAGRFLRLSTDVAAAGATVPPNLIAGGTLEIGADVAVSPSATFALNLADGSGVKWLGNATFGNSGHDLLTLAGGTAGVTFDASSGGTLNLAGRLAGGGPLVVAGGTGTLSLNAANTGFTGSVSVGGGATLRLANALALNGAPVTVVSGSRIDIALGAESIHLDALSPIGPGATIRVSTDLAAATPAAAAVLPGTLVAAGGTLELNADVGASAAATNLASINIQPGSTVRSVAGRSGSAAAVLGNATVSAAAITVSAGTAAVTIDTPASSDLTLRGQVAGGATFNKTGAGTLYLGRGGLGVSAFNVQQGTLALGELTAANAYAAPVGSTTFGPVTLQSAGTLDVGGGAVTILGLNGTGRVGAFLGSGGGAATLTVDTGAAANAFAGSITESGGHTLSLVKLGTGSLQLSGATNSNFSGGVLVTEGTLIAQGTFGGSVSFGSLGGGTSAVTVGAAGTAAAALLLGNASVLSKPVVVAAGAGAVTLGGTATNTTTASFGGAITLNRSITATGRASFGGNITGTGGISVSGNANVQFSGSNNTYTGGTFLNGGTTTVTRDTAFGTGALVLGTATILSDTNPRTLANAVTLAGNSTYGSTTNSGSLTFTGPVTLSGDATLTVRNVTTFSGPVAGNFAITKAGAGTLIMTNYGGPLTVTGGKLVVNGAISGTGTVNVTGGAVIGGSGTIAGSLAVAGGATLAPGNSPGVVTVAGRTLQLGGGSTYAVDVDGTTAGQVPTGYDQTNHTATNGTAVDLGGTGTNGAVLALNVGAEYLAGGAVGDRFFIVNDALGPVTGNFALDTGAGLVALTDGTSFTDPASGASFAVHYNDVSLGLNPLGTTFGVVLTTSAIPEPTGVIALAALTLPILLPRRRRCCITDSPR